MTIRRTIFYVSDGTGLTAEALGHSLLTQFEDVVFREVRIPFDDRAKGPRCRAPHQRHGRGKTGYGPSSSPPWSIRNWPPSSMRPTPSASPFSKPSSPLLKPNLASVEKPYRRPLHGSADSSDYKKRIEAINYTLAHDDGITDRDLEQADVVLVAVSRCGKTPTSLYLAIQFRTQGGQFPLIPEDFDRGRLPGTLSGIAASFPG